MKKLVFFLIFIIAGVLLCTSVAATAGDISPAIEFYRNTTVLDKCGVTGSNIAFTKDDYIGVIGSDINFITITALPPENEGKLMLNGVAVLSGQTIATSSLDYLTFVPTNDCAASGFTFRSQAKGWESVDVKCSIKIQEGINFSPILEGGAVDTFQDIMTQYQLSYFDADGDTVDFVIEKYPVGGTINIKDGTLTYTPVKGFTGEDTLDVYAVDAFGNRSASRTINVTVNKNKSGIKFEDMEDNGAHAAAILLASQNIAVYTMEDGEYYFMPEQTVSRIDFLVMLMNAVDLKPDESSKAASLPYEDTNKLSDIKKQYLSTAINKGIVDMGTAFNPDEAITRADAAVWISRTLQLEPVKSAAITDMDDKTDNVKVYAACVVDAGLFTMKDNNFEPDLKLDKASVAIILKNVLNYSK